MSIAPRWVRVLRRKVLLQPGMTETPVCQACGRRMAVRDMRPTGYCSDCTTEIEHAWDDTEDDGRPFLPSDENV